MSKFNIFLSTKTNEKRTYFFLNNPRKYSIVSIYLVSNKSKAKLNRQFYIINKFQFMNIKFEVFFLSSF